MRARILAVAMAATILAGCGKSEPQKTPLAFDQVPEKVLKAARAKVPGVKFDQAWREPNGNYELKGKNARGKVIEVDVDPDGQVTDVEG